MVQSSEYPDLRWVAPASYSPGRPGGSPRFIVIHTTEGSSHSQSAEDGAAYDGRRTDGTSTHYFVDSDSVVQCVRTTDRAHTAGYTGNMRGIQYELCAKASYGSAWWSGGSYALAMLQRAAVQCARDARKYGIPVKRITPADLRAGGSGFVGHVDVTYAWGEVDHTDPGPSFPWSLFLEMVNKAMNPSPATQQGEDEEEMLSDSHPIPAGYAFDADGETLIDKSKVLLVGTEPHGLKGHPFVAARKMFLSIGSDFSSGGSTRLRVAIHNGSGWTIKTVTVKDGDGRTPLELPPAGGDSAYKIEISRVRPAVKDGEEVPAGDGPLFLLVTVL